MAISAIVDKRRLKRRLDAGYLGEIDISLKLFLGRRLEIEMFEPTAVEYDDASFLRVHRIDKHTLCHKAVAP